MYTQCPECETAFRITTEQLRIGQGRVKCSKCGALFDAISSLSDFAFEDHYADLRRLPTLPLEQALAPPVADEGHGKRDMEAEPYWRKPALLSLRPSRIAWFFGVAVLLIMLGIQFSFFKGPDLLQNPNLRPWFESACARLECDLPSYRDPAAIEILEQSLQPFGQGALEFRAVIINGSPFVQAFPRLKLDLIKFNGDPLARRVFFPEEYLAKTVSEKGRMEVGKAFEIKLKIANPNSQVGGYHFSLI
jgi:predicted Zn finger-like uncharacterized protein